MKRETFKNHDWLLLGPVIRQNMVTCTVFLRQPFLVDTSQQLCR